MLTIITLGNKAIRESKN